MKVRLHKAFSELLYQKKVLNQKDFGDKIGYNKAYVSRVFNGSEDVSHKMASEIQTQFGISATWLLTGDGPMFVNAHKNTVETPADNANNSVTSSDYSPLNEKDMTIHTLAAANRDLAETNRKVVSEMLELSKELRVLLHEMKQDARPKSKAS